MAKMTSKDERPTSVSMIALDASSGVSSISSSGLSLPRPGTLAQYSVGLSLICTSSVVGATVTSSTSKTSRHSRPRSSPG